MDKLAEILAKTSAKVDKERLALVRGGCDTIEHVLVFGMDGEAEGEEPEFTNAGKGEHVPGEGTLENELTTVPTEE